MFDNGDISPSRERYEHYGAVERGLCHCGCGERTSIAVDSHDGNVPGEPRYFLRGHHRRVLSGPDYLEEDRGHETPCWIWQRAKTSAGYATCGAYRGGNGYGHRLYYEIHVGPIPDGYELDHLCRQPSCVNPDHLEPVPHAVNVQRGRRGRLTEETVRDIRCSGESHVALARRYGVSDRTIWMARSGRSWRNVT